MSRIDEIILRTHGVTEDYNEDGKFIDDMRYLLDKLEIAEKALGALERSNVLTEVDVEEILGGARFLTGTEIMINEENKRRLESGNKAKRMAVEALQQLRS